MKKLAVFTALALLLGSALFAQTPKAFADRPLRLTSIGQSADIEMVRVLLARAKFDAKSEPLIKASDLNGSAKTLVLVIGGSSKGLGAAGISAEAEMERAKALVAKAKSLGMKIISVHVGGEARRGTLSDGFINYAVPQSDYVIVVSEADKDGLFTALAGGAKIPLTKVDKIAQVGAPLTGAFK
ncbi:MAG: DUF6305 family protein [Spirochaetaceae bacterium]|nr:DUF6305 family protein [Spirochaetaceae bacterium]